MATLEVRQIPTRKDNYVYLLRESGQGKIGVVDPSDAAPVIAALEEVADMMGAPAARRVPPPAGPPGGGRAAAQKGSYPRRTTRRSCTTSSRSAPTWPSTTAPRRTPSCT